VTAAIPRTASSISDTTDLGVLITIWGDRADALEDLALNLNQVDEIEWRDAVQEKLVPFDPEQN
jgi:hypothetical protein